MNTIQEGVSAAIGNNVVFPYLLLEDVLTCKPEAESHFEAEFDIHQFNHGYILANETTILDARGFVATNIKNTMGPNVDTYFLIMRKSEKYSPVQK